MAKIPCNFRLSEETIDRLKGEAKQLGCSQAEVIEGWAKTLSAAPDTLGASPPEKVMGAGPKGRSGAAVLPLAARRANAKPFTVAKQRHEVKE